MKNQPGSGNSPGPAKHAGRKRPPAYDSPEWRSLWLRFLEAACAEWREIPYNDLAMSGGEPRTLTRLVDMHYDLPDGAARRQVDAFLRECKARI